MTLFTLNKKEGTKFYVPTISNTPLKCTATDPDEFCIEIADSFWVNTKGCTDVSPNPVAYPYTQKWYELLLPTCPNLQPFGAAPVPEYNKVYHTLRKLVPKVHAYGSDVSYDAALRHAIPVGIEEGVGSEFYVQWRYNVPVNPYTFKPCKTVAEYFKIPETFIPF